MHRIPFAKKEGRGKQTLLGALLAFAVVMSASAQTGEPLTLAAAIDQAYQLSPELSATSRGIGIAQGERIQAGLMPNPVVSWDREDTRSKTSTTTVLLSQTLELGGKRGARVDVATRGQELASLELEQRKQDLRSEVSQAFYAAARAQTAVDLALQSYELSKRSVEVANARVKAGKAAPIEVTRADVQYADTGLQLQRAQVAEADAYRELARVIGTYNGNIGTVQVDQKYPGPAPEASKLLARLNDTSLMRLAETRIAQSEAAVGSAKAQRIPNLTVSVGSQYDSEVRERVNVVGLSLPLPLFDRNQGNILAASRRADQAQDQRNATELTVRTKTEAAIAQWNTSYQEIQSFQKVILPGAQRAVDSALRGFQIGKFGFFEVLDAQRTLITARNQYLVALASAADSRSLVESIYGDVNTLLATQ